MKFLLSVAMMLLAGCAHPAMTASAPVGRFYSIGFNSSARLEIEKGGRYRFTYDVTNCDLTGFGGWETGRWTLSGDIVKLTPDPKYVWAETPMYARLRVIQQDGHRQLISDVKNTPAYQKFGFDEEEPNKSPEPMPGLRPAMAHL